MLVDFLNGIGIKLKVRMDGEIVGCLLFLWCFDKKAQSRRALNLILIHFWLVIILTWLIIKAEPSKQEFRFNLLKLQNIFNHSLSAKDWLIYKCNMEQKTDSGLRWRIISINNLNPIKFSQSLPRLAQIGDIRKFNVNRGTFLPSVWLSCRTWVTWNQTFSMATILYILHKDPRVTRNVKRRRA